MRKLRRLIDRRIKRELKGSPDHMKSAVIFLSFAALMYFKSRLMPLYADDYPYSFIWDGDNNGNLAKGNQKYRRVRSFRDLLESQISHYKTWDGRTLAESLAQIFLIPDDKRIFDRANTLLLLAQLMLCASLGSGEIAGLRSIKPEKAMLLTAGFFFSAPHLIATCLWLTGSMNYLWMGILQSAFVLPYSLKYHGTLDKLPGSLAFLSGLLSGWSTETGAGASLMLASLETLYSIKQKEYASWMGFGLLGSLAGILLLLLSPGNRIKMELEKEGERDNKTTLENAVPGYIPNEYLYTPVMFKKWFKDGFLATVLRELPLQIPVIMYFLKGKGRNRKTDLFILALEAAVFAVPSVMMISPQYPRRSTYSSSLFLLSAAARSLDHLDIPDFSALSPVQKLITGAVIAALSVSAVSSLIVDADNSVQFDRQISYIKNNRHEPMICVEDVDIPLPYTLLAGDRSLSFDSSMGICFTDEDNQYNKAAAAYYGINKIKCTSWEDHVYEQEDLSSRLFSIINPLKSLVIKTKEIIKGRKEYDPLDTVYYPLKRYGRLRRGYYVYEKLLKGNSSPIVYSFGNRSDPSFREAVLKRTGAAVFSFGYSRLPDLRRIAKKYGHDHIDLLKIDIYGDSFDALRSLKKSRIAAAQICLYIHERSFCRKEKRLARFIDFIHKLGYIVIHYDKRSSGFTFLKRDVSEDLTTDDKTSGDGR